MADNYFSKFHEKKKDEKNIFSKESRPLFLMDENNVMRPVRKHEMVGDKGEKGDKGDKGDAGVGISGKNGRGIDKSLLQGDTLYIRYDDGKTEKVGKIVGRDGIDGKDGLDGKDGINGRDGVDGVDGRGIAGAEINKEGELVLSFVDGVEENLGKVRGEDGQTRIVGGSTNIGVGVMDDGTLIGTGISLIDFTGSGINSITRVDRKVTIDVSGGGGGTTSPLTTKGDLYTYSTVNDRLGVGLDGQVLTADSSEPTGLKWAAGGSGAGSALYLKVTFSSVTSHSITHNFGVYPLVNILDTTGAEIIPLSLTHTSLNTFVITFASATSGCALITAGEDGSTLYLKTPFTSATSQNVVHGFGAEPIVDVLDNSGAEIIPLSVVHNSLNDFTVTFSASTTGNILATAGGAGGSGGGGSAAFSAITGSTNTTAAMVVGTGASITASGSGDIQATSVLLGSNLDSYIIAMATAL